MRKACELGAEGDDSLCRVEDCPWYGEPNGCNHPAGQRDDAPYGNAAALRNALLYCVPRIMRMRDDALGDSGNVLIDDLVYASCCNMLDRIGAALAEPGRNCDRGDAKETWELFLQEEHPEVKRPLDPTVAKVLAEEYAGHWLFRKEKHGKEENEEKTEQGGT